MATTAQAEGGAPGASVRLLATSDADENVSDQMMGPSGKQLRVAAAQRGVEKALAQVQFAEQALNEALAEPEDV